MLSRLAAVNKELELAQKQKEHSKEIVKAILQKLKDELMFNKS